MLNITSLGPIFLAEHGLAPNQRDGNLIDLDSFDSIPMAIASGEPPAHVTFVNEIEDPYYRLLDQYRVDQKKVNLVLD